MQLIIKVEQGAELIRSKYIQILSCQASLIVFALTGQATKMQTKKKLEDRESQETSFIGNKHVITEVRP